MVFITGILVLLISMAFHHATLNSRPRYGWQSNFIDIGAWIGISLVAISLAHFGYFNML